MSKPIIIIGAGGHAKVLAEALRLSSRRILGFVTPDIEAGSEFFGSKILGNDSIILDYSTDEIELVNGVGALPGKYHRWNLAAKMREKSYNFTTVIHPDAVIASDAVLEEGVQVMAGVVVQPTTTIGRDTIINTGVLLDHDCDIAENCHLSPGVVCGGGVSVGVNTHIGLGTKIIQGINVGNACVIAAGSTIYQDVPSGIQFRQKMNIVIKEVGS